MLTVQLVTTVLFGPMLWNAAPPDSSPAGSGGDAVDGLRVAVAVQQVDARSVRKQAVAERAVTEQAADRQAADRQAARDAVERIFEGMRAADPDRVREVFAADVRFALLGPDGEVAVQSLDGWLEALGASGGSWDERIYDVEVRVDGDVASVWAPYTFYLDGEVQHCGTNSIELLRDAAGWKVTQISDTRRTEGCPDPAG